LSNNITSIPLRRSELISPFGVGAISTNNDGINLMTGALDLWFSGQNLDTSEYIINEARLARVLGVNNFRLPPDYRSILGKSRGEERKNINVKIPMVLFPTWFYCSFCKKMDRLHLADISKKKKCKHCVNGHLVQVPFVVVCQEGHIDDFPWIEWVHENLTPACSGTLKLVSTGGATLTSMRVECTNCNSTRSLKGITSKSDNNSSKLFSQLEKGKHYHCTGRKHWYGTSTTAHENCSEQPFVLLKNSNNVYYPNILSALYLPGDNSQEFEKTKEFLTNTNVLNEITIYQESKLSNDQISKILINKYSADLHFTNENLILKSLHSLSEEAKEIEESEYENINLSMKYEEFSSLIEEHNNKDLKVVKEFNKADNNNEINNFGIQKIHLVHKLRDTRVLYGFQRFKGDQAISKETIKKGRELLFKSSNHTQTNWLPGYTVYGEGIFIEFSEFELSEWEANVDVLQHFDILKLRYNQIINDGILKQKEITPRYVMLHTLAHILISEMIFECGYSSSALRERIYVSKDPEKKMSGILIYTASGDSEGTLGGLVRLGKLENLIPILRRGLEKSKWCSSDPVCTDIGINSGQGIHSLNIAACHNCSYLPETSCEEFNMFLDRSLLTGVLGKRGIGFFESVSY